MRKSLATLVFLLVLVLAPIPVFASLELVNPSSPVRDPNIASYPFSETGQKGVIWYENGQETLTISTVFQGNPSDFGWLIPVPSKPTVEKASDELFTSLADLTVPKYRTNTGPIGPLFGASGLRDMQTAPVAPTISEGETAGIFDITVLSASDDKGLRDWLTNHNYPYPTDRTNVIQSYVSGGWYFVAVKVNPDASSASDYLSQGHATPLQIKFATNRIIYPLKLSGPGIDSGASSTKVAAFSFEQGVENFYGVFQGKYTPPTGGGTQYTYPKVNLSLDNSTAKYGNVSLQATGANLTGQDVVAQSYASNLKPGKTYVASAWAKSDAKSGSLKVNITGATSYSSSAVSVADASSWKQLAVVFTAPASSVNISLSASGFSDGDTVNWDGVQIEEGSKPTDFTVEILPSLGRAGTLKNGGNASQTVLLYVFADHKKELPGFNISYASFVSPKQIEKLAFSADGQSPWVKAKKKMYLTKLSRSMTTAEMQDDLVFRDAANDTPVNADTAVEVSTFRFFGVIVLVLLLEVVGIVWFLKFRKKKNAEIKPAESETKVATKPESKKSSF